MFLIDDVITYMRRILKTPSDISITDNLLIDYINRFYINDVDARIQLFDLKTTYQFQTQPGVDQYNMPLYSTQEEPGGQTVGMYPVYQGFLDPCTINGVSVPINTLRNSFFNIYPDIVQNFQGIAQGDSSGSGPYNIQIPILPSSAPQNPPFNAILRGHIDMSGIIYNGNNNLNPSDPPSDTGFPRIPSTNFINIPVTSMKPRVWITSIDGNGNNVVVTDSGYFLNTNVNCGLLMRPGPAPFGNKTIGNNIYTATKNTINYLTGAINVTFPVAIPLGNNINVQVFFFEGGLPRSILFYNNVLTLRSIPAQQYLVELSAYLTPAAFLNSSDSLPFGYMGEYIARGAARKILTDTGDVEQFQFYEPLFQEQEMLVWKRSQRQWTATRTPSLYSQGFNQQTAFNNLGGGTL